VIERFLACFAAHDWTALADTLTDEFCSDDRRRVVNAGIQDRNDLIKSFRSAADLGVTHTTTVVTATRGDCLVLIRVRFWGPDEEPEAFLLKLLQIVETHSDQRIVALVSFDADDFDRAIAELDARYLAGEAAPYSRTWSTITRAYAAINRHELPATTPDWVNIDHRRAAAFAPGDALAYIRAAWDLTVGLKLYVQDERQLSDLGAVVAHASVGSSREGFDAEWRWVNIFAVDGDMISRCGIFDEADVDAALAMFDELHPQTRRLANTASRIAQRFLTQFATRDWATLAETFADDFPATIADAWWEPASDMAGTP
jgi:hypothetical protein